jgi:hypothetical protein
VDEVDGRRVRREIATGEQALPGLKLDHAETIASRTSRVAMQFQMVWFKCVTYAVVFPFKLPATGGRGCSGVRCISYDVFR